MKKEELAERLRAARAKGPRYFAERYSRPEEIARLAYNSTIIERGKKVALPERKRLQEGERYGV